MACSAQTHKSISFIWIVWSTLYAYLWLFDGKYQWKNKKMRAISEPCVTSAKMSQIGAKMIWSFSQYLNFKGCMDNNDLVMLLNSGGLERGRDFEEPGDINFDKLYVHWILYVHFFLNRCTIFVLLYVLGEKNPKLNLMYLKIRMRAFVFSCPHGQ